MAIPKRSNGGARGGADDDGPGASIWSYKIDPIELLDDLLPAGQPK